MIRVRPGTPRLACFAVMALLLVGCGEKQEPAAGAASSGAAGPSSERAAAPPSSERAAITPPPDARWQYQLEASPERADDSSGRIDVDICRRPASGGECVRPRVIDFDLYLDRRGTDDDSTLNRAGVDALHAHGGYAVCYVDAGSAELFRPDFPRFRRWHRSHGRSLLGNPFSRRFPDERWINVGARKQRRFVLGVMEERTAKCARAGFDAVEYDVVEAWSAGRRTTGWNVSYRDQLTYNRSLARLAHEQGLAVGLKNDLGQVRALVDEFDFAINEECAGFNECRVLRAFTRQDKPVFHVEYELEPGRFCEQTQGRLGFQSIKKARDFSLRPLPYVPCE